MKKRLAMTTDGKLTYCSATEETVGKGRCNHIAHQSNVENQEEFMNRAANLQEELKRKDNSNRRSSNGFYNTSELLQFGFGFNQNHNKKDKTKFNDYKTKSNKPYESNQTVNEVKKFMKRRGRRLGRNIATAAFVVALSVGVTACQEGTSLTETFNNARTEVINKLGAHRSGGLSSKTVENTSSTYKTATRDEVEELQESIKIKPRDDVKYDRDTWGTNTPSYEYTLDGALEKTNSPRKAAIYKSAWYNPETQEYTDPYTGGVVTDFKRWSGSGALQFDHVIPLSYVASEVGDSWSQDKKNQYAYDLNIGVNADASLNGIKSDKGPSEWLPPVNQASYCYSWLYIANKYDIPLAQEDFDKIDQVLDNSDESEFKIINEYNK